MIDPVGPRIGVNPWSAYQPGLDLNKPSSVNTRENTKRKTEEDIASLYYVSTLQSLKASEEAPSEISLNKVMPIEVVTASPTVFQKFKTWLSSLFGKEKSSEIHKQQETEVSTQVTSAPVISSIPQLQSPENVNHAELSKAITKLNCELLQRMKETMDFEQEMRQCNSKKIDRLILFHLISKSLEQKKIKEERGLGLHERILALQQSNKDLHKTHYEILGEINSMVKTNQVLHWVNIGTAVGIAGMLVGAVATGGGANVVFGIALSGLNLIKGGFSVAEGALKYKIDLRKGRATMIGHSFDTNKKEINDHVSTTLPFADEEISHLLKTIRRHLENYHQEARIGPQSSS